MKNKQDNIKRCACPKCGGTDLILTELWKNHSTQFYYSNGRITNCKANEVGDPYKVEACCDKCGHEWKLRGVSQISDIELLEVKG